MNEDDVDTIGRAAGYEGYSRLYEYRLRHRLFDGGWSKEISRELLERGNAVCVLPYDPLRDEVVLIEQFRIGAYAAGLPPWQREIVAGVVEDGESDEDVARREIVEECGCAARELHFVARCLSSSGIMSEVATVYCATVDSSGVQGSHGLTDEHEDIRATAWPFEDAYRLVLDGAFQHAQGIIALQWLAANRDRLRSNGGNST
ncbi:MAG: NUDIX domain-containing protein [Rhodospirillaceae bacterium]